MLVAMAKATAHNLVDRYLNGITKARRRRVSAWIQKFEGDVGAKVARWGAVAPDTWRTATAAAVARQPWAAGWPISVIRRILWLGARLGHWDRPVAAAAVAALLGQRPGGVRRLPKRDLGGFRYDAVRDLVVCPVGKESAGSAPTRLGRHYFFSVYDCRDCPRAARCLTEREMKDPMYKRKRLYLSNNRVAALSAMEAKT